MEHPYNHVQISKKKKSEMSYCINFMPGSGTKNLELSEAHYDIILVLRKLEFVCEDWD